MEKQSNMYRSGDVFVMLWEVLGGFGQVGGGVGDCFGGLWGGLGKF